MLAVSTLTARLGRVQGAVAAKVQPTCFSWSAVPASRHPKCIITEFSSVWPSTLTSTRSQSDYAPLQTCAYASVDAFLRGNGEKRQDALKEKTAGHVLCRLSADFCAYLIAQMNAS